MELKRVVIEKNIANAKELYRRIECGACCADEFEYVINSILNNIEETSFVFLEKDLRHHRTIVSAAFAQSFASSVQL